MTAIIRIFRVGERCYSHVLNTLHDSVELRDEQDSVLLVYGADARVRSRGGRIGKFETEYLDGRPHWVYYESDDLRPASSNDGSQPDDGYGDAKAIPTRVVLGPDLPTAEVEISRRYILRQAACA